jgi:hypothetical protein
MRASCRKGGDVLPHPLETSNLIKQTETTSSIVIHNDAILYEKYFHGYIEPPGKHWV